MVKDKLQVIYSNYYFFNDSINVICNRIKFFLSSTQLRKVHLILMQPIHDQLDRSMVSTTKY